MPTMVDLDELDPVLQELKDWLNEKGRLRLCGKSSDFAKQVLDDGRSYQVSGAMKILDMLRELRDRDGIPIRTTPFKRSPHGPWAKVDIKTLAGVEALNLLETRIVEFFGHDIWSIYSVEAVPLEED